MKRPSVVRRQNRGRGGGSKERRKIMRRVIERDKGICWLCGEPVDLTLTFPHPLSKSMDHVVPHSKGGKFTFANLRLAHRICNDARGAESA